MNFTQPTCIDFGNFYTNKTYDNNHFMFSVNDFMFSVDDLILNLKPNHFIRAVLLGLIILHTFVFAYTIGVYYTYKKVFNNYDNNRKNLKRRHITVTIEESDEESEEEDPVEKRRKTLRSYKRQKYN